MTAKTEKKKGRQSSTSMIKVGFQLSIGSWLFSVLVIFVAAALFLPGMYLVRQARKEKEDGGDDEERGAEGEQDGEKDTKKIVGFVLMGLGMVVGLGFGSYFLLPLLWEEM